MIQLDEIEPRELVPGGIVRVLHTQNVSITYWEFAAGAVIPEHAHSHEQVTMVTEGALELRLGEVTHHLVPGTALVIPPDAPHGGMALEPSRVMDVFYPLREDYRW